MSPLDELFDANRRYAEDFDGTGLTAPPSKRLAVLTCMDARLHPESFLGIPLGGAHVVRNAGGRATDDAIRSLVISTRLLGTTAIAVIHHTDCGMLGLSNEELQAELQDETGVDASGIDFLPFSDLDEGVREDVEVLEASPFLDAEVEVAGYVFDVRTGALREIVPPNRATG